MKEYIKKCVEEDLISSNDIDTISVLIYYLRYTQNNIYGISEPDKDLFLNVVSYIENAEQRKEEDIFEQRLFGSSSKNSKIKITYTIDDIDMLDGYEFENIVAKIFSHMGYDARVTKSSGDQGIDIIAEKNGIRYGILAKCYSSTVGNSAIQEAAAGKNYYNLDKVIVVTNNRFSKSAIKLAQVNNVVLWDRTILTEKLIYIN